jgi:DNA-nicking Smr family endonuclease
MKGRPASEEEKKLFRKSVDEAAPAIIARKKAGKPLRKGASGGLDGHTRERLKRGAVRVSARLDLHGFTQDAAHRALLAFFRQARKHGLRLTLVITGQGSPGVLKAMVPRWLGQPEFAALIAGVEPAHSRHGGAGALYVYLRK